MNIDDGEKDYNWKDEHETILKGWGDKSLCFKMMHERANKRFWCLNAWFNIPVIIISTISGTSNFASSNFGNYADLIILVSGGLNIFSGILATIATYTGVAQQLEAHKFASISWDKFARKIQIELAKSRDDRARAKDFLKQASEEYNRLLEMSPILPNDIIRWFSNVVETGEPESQLGDCETCCFECVCFPFGCTFCSCFHICCFNFSGMCKKNQKKNVDSKILWKQIELPEILGRIKPTEIAIEPEPVVEVKKQENIVNMYDIYSTT